MKQASLLLAFALILGLWGSGIAFSRQHNSQSFEQTQAKLIAI